MTPRFEAEIRALDRGWMGTVEVTEGTRLCALAETQDDLLEVLRRTVSKQAGLPIGSFELEKRVVRPEPPGRFPGPEGSSPKSPSASADRSVLDNLASLPGLLSLVRLPLAVAFPFTMGHVPLALATMAMAGISDVLDGWVARRTGRSSTTGALLDPIMDKAFVLTALVTLLVVGCLTFPAVLLLMARDLLELPLVAWAATQPAQVVAHRRELRANREGKATTILQFATLFAALVEPRWVMPLAVAAGVSGLVATATYARRTLHQLRDHGSARSL